MTLEKDLIKGCLNQDFQSQQAIYDIFASKMLGICYRYLGNINEAEFLLQRAFVKIFTEFHRYTTEISLENWLCQTMVTFAVDYVKQKNDLTHIVDKSQAEDLSYEPIEADANLNAKDIIETLKSLPIGFRTVLNLYSIDGYSHKEISLMLQISESVSRSQYVRGRMLIARILSAKGRIQSIGNETVKI